MSVNELRTWLTSRGVDAEVRSFQRQFGVFGDVERRTFKHTVGETRKAGTVKSGRSDGSLQVVGHAAVFNQPSVEMTSPFGSFTEYIDARAFDNVLSQGPDVIFDWDHDTRYTLARTANKTLELTVDEVGLRYWARVPDVSYARDLQILMEGGYIDQSSFLFRIAPGGEDWVTRELEDGATVIERTIYDVGGLYDVCVCAAGAYPTTDSGLARSLAVEYASERGFISVPRAIINPETQDTPDARAIGEIAWGPEEGVNDLECDIECLLNSAETVAGEEIVYWRYSVVDISLDKTKAMICDWEDYSYWVIPITVGSDNEPTVGPADEWMQVEVAWVTTSEGYEANIRSAKMRREARMAGETETAEVVETEVETATADETEAATATTDAETTETEAEETAPEAEAETEVEETEDDAARSAAAVTRAIAEARARIARAKTV